MRYLDKIENDQRRPISFEEVVKMFASGDEKGIGNGDLDWGLRIHPRSLLGPINGYTPAILPMNQNHQHRRTHTMDLYEPAHNLYT